MNYTLDTAAIRKRFEQAIIGIRDDGTMAVLVAVHPNEDYGYMDIVSGKLFHDVIHYPTLIRPGDRCESEDSDGKITGVYRGFSGDLTLPHCIQPSTYVCPMSDPTPPIYHLQSIRPLPAAETEAKPEPERDPETKPKAEPIALWCWVSEMSNRTPHKCPVCDGTGQTNIFTKCKPCDGTGIVWG